MYWGLEAIDLTTCSRALRLWSLHLTFEIDFSVVLLLLRPVSFLTRLAARLADLRLDSNGDTYGPLGPAVEAAAPAAGWTIPGAPSWPPLPYLLLTSLSFIGPFDCPPCAVPETCGRRADYLACPLLLARAGLPNLHLTRTSLGVASTLSSSSSTK